MTSTQYALTTTFTPAASCSPGSFDQLLWDQQYIYFNYPNPVPAATTPGCYPTEFLQSYTAQNTISTLLPPLAPLVCPAGWSSAAIDYAPDVPIGYLACCPSGYELAGPSPPWPETRPAYNATCRSLATSLTITPYSTDSALPVAIWTGTAGDHAYAVPLEGYVTAMVNSTGTGAVLTSGSTASSAASTNSSSTTSSSPLSTSSSTVLNSTQSTQSSAPTNTSTTEASRSNSNSLSHGDIAGIVIGSVVGLFIIVAIAAYWIRRMQKRSRVTSPDEATSAHPSSTDEKPKFGGFFHRSAKQDHVSEMPDGQGSRVELPTGPDRPELSAGERAERSELPS